MKHKLMKRASRVCIRVTVLGETTGDEQQVLIIDMVFQRMYMYVYYIVVPATRQGYQRSHYWRVRTKLLPSTSMDRSPDMNHALVVRLSVLANTSIWPQALYRPGWLTCFTRRLFAGRCWNTRDDIVCYGRVRGYLD